MLRLMGKTTLKPPTLATADHALAAAAALSKYKRATGVTVKADGKSAESVSIPLDAFQHLLDVLAHMGQGYAIHLMPVSVELTTQQAADMYNVSFTKIQQVLDSGEIPGHMQGRYRRVQSTDALEYARTTPSKPRTRASSAKAASKAKPKAKAKTGSKAKAKR